ncbi:hypothetical protein CISIN_1g026977mg [Citrus sinensis]|uniref:Cytokinin riboside 5'-monophosphate phosphoribohydrolase n=1 Tax=Citrus sinensis TaxID=2711 RepID=A0A067FYJ4_CITSI|nr:hypothetical protein CISIN_1g026977mg [Citrus sinensis]
MEMEGKIQKNSRFKRVCVFCGSSTGKRNCYSDAAIDLAHELVARRLDLVYGGGSIGLMGLVSKAVHHGGGNVIGIIPRTLMNKEITGETVGEVRPVADMHQRKAEMARHSDCFIALPGGYGTLEELLEVITWAQLGIHDKPVCVANKPKSPLMMALSSLLSATSLSQHQTLKNLFKNLRSTCLCMME